jgi:hypothetical protein
MKINIINLSEQNVSSSHEPSKSIREKFSTQSQAREDHEDTDKARMDDQI